MSRLCALAVAATIAAVFGDLPSPSWQALAQTPGTVKPVIIAYVFPRNELIVPSEIAADKLTHINYAFADIKDGRIVEGFAHDADNFKLLADLRRQHPHLRILISVGGWTWSGNFSDAALTAESRRRFTESAIAFVRRHDIDGVDIDWEYPGLRGNNNVHRPEDRENFTAMMTELRQALDAEGRVRGRQYLLTFAAGASPDFIAHTEMDKVQAVVDFVNLMTYDFRTSDPIAGHHANLYLNPADAKQRSVDSAVREFITAGVPPAKLVVGVPFYGRAWAAIEGDGTGPYQPGSRPTERIDTKYDSLAATRIDRGGFVRMWDSQAQAPYLWNKETRTFISYDDPESLRLKSAYIRGKGLAGTMFWEYSGDKTGVLLDTLFTSLRGPAVAQQLAPAQPGTQWTDEQLRQGIALARVGRRLTPKVWPNRSRVAVCLSFDTDTEAPHLRDGTTSPTTLSAADFGAESGVPRILRMLDRHHVPATFFMTGVDALLHPEMVQAIVASGRHEVGVHGWIHEFPPRLEPAEEERLLDRAIEYLTKVTGKRPVGYRAPSWAFSGSTLDLVVKKRFLYDSSLQALDEPYEIVSRGASTGVVELPIDWTLTETPYLGQNGRMPSPTLLYQLYREEFDGAYKEGTTFILTLHPYLSGHRAPMQHLDDFVAYMKSKPGVWFATCEQIARYVKDPTVSGAPR